MIPSAQTAPATTELNADIIARGFTSADADILKQAIRAFGNKIEANLASDKLGRMLDQLPFCSYMLSLAENLRTGKYATPHTAILIKLMKRIQELNPSSFNPRGPEDNIDYVFNILMARALNGKTLNKKSLEKFINSLLNALLPDASDDTTQNSAKYITARIMAIYGTRLPSSLSAESLKQIFTRIFILEYVENIIPLVETIKEINFVESEVRPGRMRLSREIRKHIEAELKENDPGINYPEFMRIIGIRLLCNHLKGGKNILREPDNYKFYLSELTNKQKNELIRAAKDKDGSYNKLSIILSESTYAQFNEKLAYLGEEFFAQNWLTSHLLAIGIMTGDMHLSDSESSFLTSISIHNALGQIQEYDWLACDPPSLTSRIQLSEKGIISRTESYLADSMFYEPETSTLPAIAATELFKPIIAKIATLADPSLRDLAMYNAISLRSLIKSSSINSDKPYNRANLFALIGDLASAEPLAIANKINALSEPMNKSRFNSQVVFNSNLPPTSKPALDRDALIQAFIDQFAEPAPAREIRTKLLVQFMNNFKNADQVLENIAKSLRPDSLNAFTMQAREAIHNYIKDIFSKRLEKGPHRAYEIIPHIAQLYKISGELEFPFALNEINQIKLGFYTALNTQTGNASDLNKTLGIVDISAQILRIQADERITASQRGIRNASAIETLKTIHNFLKATFVESLKINKEQAMTIIPQLVQLYQISSKLDSDEMYRLLLTLRNEIHTKNAAQWPEKLNEICLPIAESRHINDLTAKKSDFVANLKSEWQSTAIIESEILIKRVITIISNSKLTAFQRTVMQRQARAEIEKIIKNAIVNEPTKTVILANETYRFFNKYEEILVIPEHDSSYQMVIDKGNRKITRKVTGTFYRLCEDFRNEFNINVKTIEDERAALATRNKLAVLDTNTTAWLKNSQRSWLALLRLSIPHGPRPVKLPPSTPQVPTTIDTVAASTSTAQAQRTSAESSEPIITQQTTAHGEASTGVLHEELLKMSGMADMTVPSNRNPRLYKTANLDSLSKHASGVDLGNTTDDDPIALVR